MTGTEFRLDTTAKALTINLDPKFYGSFAEIGAGQEVARQFFRVGGAAGTIAKTMSAYDMKFSDDIYGKASRYVARDRLISMLDHEYGLLINRLSKLRGNHTLFFAFADTVSAQSFHGNKECHGWVGIRFQTATESEPDEIVLHLRMLDSTNLQQQQALGVFGVNLIYGAFHFWQDPERLIASLSDDLNRSRIEVDMIEFSGPNYSHVDNRFTSLKLVQHGLTNAIMFGPDRKVLQPSEVLYKRPVLVQRGSFRPITCASKEMISLAAEQFSDLLSEDSRKPVTLLEITLNNLLATGTHEDKEFLSLADTLCAEGFNVLISDYSMHFDLIAYFRRYTSELVGGVMGVNGLVHLFNEQYYNDLPGGILEAFARLFRKGVVALIYPMARETFDIFLASAGIKDENLRLPDAELIDVENIPLTPHHQHLYRFLRETGSILGIQGYNPEYTSILATDVVAMMRQGNPDWKKYVPKKAAQIIESNQLYGLKTKD